jgi:hypothetical protein
LYPLFICLGVWRIGAGGARTLVAPAVGKNSISVGAVEAIYGGVTQRKIVDGVNTTVADYRVPFWSSE